MSGEAAGVTRFIIVIQEILQLRMQNTAIRLTIRSAVRNLEASARQPVFRILWNVCRVRDWRGAEFPRPFPAPPHRNCS
jgi:hypothetical protein